MITVHHPRSLENERNYIFHVIFDEFLGLDYICVPENRTDVCISFQSTDRKLIIADRLFTTPEALWLTEHSLPEQPMSIWHIEDGLLNRRLLDRALPVIYGSRVPDGGYCKIDNGSINLGLDIFGSAFFMLTRYEEVVRQNCDIHGRFPACASGAYKEGFLDRPIVDEYVEILWHLISSLWPGLSRKKRSFKIIPTHDVDTPFCYAYTSYCDLVHGLVGDLLKRKSTKLFADNLRSIVRTKSGHYQQDPYFTFPRILDINEKYGHRSCFYFLTGRGSDFDGNYDIDHPWMENLLKNIYNRGHEIGIHLSYNSFNDNTLVREELTKLKEVCSRLGIIQNEFGARQHYLRWSAPETWNAQNQAGIDYDTTLSYADRVGFRAGTCQAFSVYDLKARSHLKLVEKPLIVMDRSIISPSYMNLDYDSAYAAIMGLRKCCQKYEGNFVILWHNNWFTDEKSFSFYESILK